MALEFNIFVHTPALGACAILSSGTMNKRNKQATARAPHRPQRDNRAPISSGIPHFMKQSPQV